jgi:hypothetical protein
MSYGSTNGGFTDDMYGDSRMSIGMDTSWQLGTFAPLDGSFDSTNDTLTNTSIATSTTTPAPSSSLLTLGGNSTSIKTIYINFTLSTSYFSDFDDIIEVYMGDVSLKGRRVTSFRGSDAVKPISNVKLAGLTAGTIVVFNSVATVNFRSRKQSGQHFSANYSVSGDCPPGYAATGFTDDAHEACTLIVPIFKLASGVQIVLFVVAGICSALLVSILILIIVFRNYVIFRAASIPFCTCIVAFGIMMTTTSVFYGLSAEEGDWLCHIRPWTSCISIIGLLACLYIKSNRINRIFNNKRLQEDGLDNKTLFKYVGLMLSMQVALLIGLSGAKLTSSQLIMGSKFTDGYQVYSCSSTETVSFNVWLAFQLFYVFAFVCAATVTAFQIRNVPTAFNESSHIANCMYVFCLIMAIILPLNFLVEDNPNALVLIRGMAQNLCALSMCLSIFSPKVFMLATGQGNDSTMAIPKMSSVLVTNDSATEKGTRKNSGNVPSKRPMETQRKKSITHANGNRNSINNPASSSSSRKPSVTNQVSRKPSVNTNMTTPLNKSPEGPTRPFGSSISIAHEDARQSMLLPVTPTGGVTSSSMIGASTPHGRTSSQSEVLAVNMANLNPDQVQSVLTYMATLRPSSTSPRASIRTADNDMPSFHLPPITSTSTSTSDDESHRDHVNRPDIERPEKHRI